MVSDIKMELSFGYAGSILLTIMLIPQVVQTFRAKNADGLSFVFLIINLLACICFITYSFDNMAYPILIANCSGLICTFLLLYAKVAFRKERLVESIDVVDESTYLFVDAIGGT